MPNSGFRKFLIASAAAAALVIGSAAATAQDYGRYGDETTYAGPNETIEVYGPRLHVERDDYGAIQRVSTSREIVMSERSLRTARGARELRRRVFVAARDVCNQLGEQIPASADWRTCYDDAVVNGLRHADSAIERARYYR